MSTYVTLEIDIHEAMRLVHDGSPVIIHSVADRPAAVREALVAGAAGVVSKASRIDDVRTAGA